MERAKINGYEITAKWFAEIEGFPFSPKDKGWHNHFKIKVQGPKTSRTIDFYGSTHDWQQGKVEMNEDDLFQAFHMFLSDAQSGSLGFDDFVDDLALKTPSGLTVPGRDVLKSLKN